MVHRTPPALSNGVYQAQLSDLKAIDGQFGPRLVWTVELLKDGFEYKATGFTDVSFYQGSREHAWASAILGVDLQPGSEITESELIGAPVVVRLSAKPARDGKTYYGIEDLVVPKSSEDSEPAGANPGQDPESDVPF
jgi:hypothetical protein